MQVKIKKTINHIIVINYEYISSNQGGVNDCETGHRVVRAQLVGSSEVTGG